MLSSLSLPWCVRSFGFHSSQQFNNWPSILISYPELYFCVSSSIVIKCPHLEVSSSHPSVFCFFFKSSTRQNVLSSLGVSRRRRRLRTTQEPPKAEHLIQPSSIQSIPISSSAPTRHFCYYFSVFPPLPRCPHSWLFVTVPEAAAAASPVVVDWIVLRGINKHWATISK